MGQAPTLTLTKALSDYVRLPTEQAGDFMKQLKSLTDKDKDDYVRIFAESGITVTRAVQS